MCKRRVMSITRRLHMGEKVKRFNESKSDKIHMTKRGLSTIMVAIIIAGNEAIHEMEIDECLKQPLKP